jgi:hypothetical protein
MIFFLQRDNCWLAYNPQQEDRDNDGKGDVCQDDTDVDGILDFMDNCPNNSKIFSTDFRTYQVCHYLPFRTGVEKLFIPQSKC